jgi:hypothetical protein
MTQAGLIQKVVSDFGAAIKAKLSNPSTTSRPEDQLRAPLVALFASVAESIGQPSDTTVLVGEMSLVDLKTRPDYSVTVAKAVGLIIRP